MAKSLADKVAGKILGLVPTGLLQRAAYYNVLDKIEDYQSKRGFVIRYPEESDEKYDDKLIIDLANFNSYLLRWSEKKRGIHSPDRKKLSEYLEQIKPIISTIEDRKNRYKEIIEGKSFLGKAQLIYRFIKEDWQNQKNLSKIKRETSKTLVGIANKNKYGRIFLG